MPPPTPQAIAQELKQLAADIPEAPFRELFMAYATPHVERFAALIGRLEGPGGEGVRRVVDVGAFPGHLTLLMAARGFEVTALAQPFSGYWPNDAFLAEMRRRGIPVVLADLERDWAGIEQASVDLAIFTEVIEHMRHNPFHAMAEIARWLRPGGRAWVSTPNLAAARYLLRLWRGRSIHPPLSEPWPEVYPTAAGAKHEREYTAAELEYFLDPDGRYPYRFEGGRVETHGWIATGTDGLGPRARVLRDWMVRLRPRLGSALFAEGRKPASLAVVTPEDWELTGEWGEPIDPLAMAGGPVPAAYPYPFRHLRGAGTLGLTVPADCPAGPGLALRLPWVWPRTAPPLPAQTVEIVPEGGTAVELRVPAAADTQLLDIPLEGAQVQPGQRLTLRMRATRPVVPDAHLHNGDRTPTGPALALAHAALTTRA